MNNTIQSLPCPECGGTGLKDIGTEQWVRCSACGETSPLEDQPAASNQWLFVFLAIILTGTFLWRAFGAAHEIPSPEYRALTIGLDLLCLVSLIGLRIQASRQQAPVTIGLNILFWIALLAGLGLFAIRMSGTRSWETGHLSYELLPRSDSHVNPVFPAANTGSNPTNTGANANSVAEPDPPSAVYKQFYAAHKNNDNAAMKALIARNMFTIFDSADKKQADEQNDELLKELLKQPPGPSDDTRNEKITGHTATVETLGPKGKWYTRNFYKVDGKWKLTL